MTLCILIALYVTYLCHALVDWRVFKSCVFVCTFWLCHGVYLLAYDVYLLSCVCHGVYLLACVSWCVLASL